MNKPTKKLFYINKLNNQGFAVAGTLYGLMLLFLVVLTSILMTLNYQVKESTISSSLVNHKTEAKELNINLDDPWLTETRGKYQITINHHTTCYSYLKENLSLTLKGGQLQGDNQALILLGDDCPNTNITSATITKVAPLP